MSTGTVSGRFSTESSTPLRRTPSVSAAPMEPSRLSAMLPINTDDEHARQRRHGRAERPGGERAHDGERCAGEQPMPDGFREQQPGERLAGERELLERAIVRVVAVQELQREQ